MASDTSTNPESYVYVGAGTGGLFRKPLEEEGWEELTNGLPPSPNVRVIAIHPLQRDVVFAGTQDGVYRSGSRGDHWRSLNMPSVGSLVWSLLFRPHTPSVMYVGTSPAQIFRTRDGGDSWEPLPIPMGRHIVAMPFDTRVIAMAGNPNNPDELYAALEVGGVIRSLDGGESWETVNSGLAEVGEPRLDLHGVLVLPGPPDTVYISTRVGMFLSQDRGDHWEAIDITKYSPITYTRDLKLSARQPTTMYVSLGESARGEKGGLLRSWDLGETWEKIDHGITARSTMMAVSISSRRPAHIYCATRGGQVFGSLDDGATWQEYPLPEGSQEVYALAVA